VSRNHRKPRTRTPRLRRTLAGISLAAAAVTTGLAAADNLSGASGTAVWGALDTDLTVATVATTDTGAEVGTAVGDVSVSTTTGVDVTVTPLDTAWG
jgi:hypothetical protein